MEEQLGSECDLGTARVQPWTYPRLIMEIEHRSYTLYNVVEKHLFRAFLKIRNDVPLSGYNIYMPGDGGTRRDAAKHSVHRTSLACTWYSQFIVMTTNTRVCSLITLIAVSSVSNKSTNALMAIGPS
jgi:hypothetical protein